MEGQKEKRDRWLHVRLTEEERESWKKRAQEEGVSVADLVRELMNRQVGRRKRKRKVVSESSAELVRAVARCGNNLNQIARWCNTNKSAAESLKVYGELVAIERELREALDKT